jgi:hypothetical protein
MYKACTQSISNPNPFQKNLYDKPDLPSTYPLYKNDFLEMRRQVSSDRIGQRTVHPKVCKKLELELL